MAYRDLTMEDMKGIEPTQDGLIGELTAVTWRAKQIIIEIDESNRRKVSRDAGKSSRPAAEVVNSKHKRRAVDNGPPSPPPLPEEIKEAILKMAGEERTSSEGLLICRECSGAAAEKEAAARPEKCKDSNTPRPTRRAVDDGPQPPPPLPESFKNAILKMAGGKSISPATLVIQKGLFETDLSDGHNRLSIPLSKISGSFLSEEEKEFLCGRNESNKMNCKEVKIIEPSLEREKVTLSRWDMAKRNGKTCSTCVIKEKWRYIVSRNGLRVGNVVQIWAFRIEDELCFALVKLPV